MTLPATFDQDSWFEGSIYPGNTITNSSPNNILSLTSTIAFAKSWSLGGSATLLDGPLPYGDAVGAAIGIGGTIVAGWLWAYDAYIEYCAKVREKAIDSAITEIKNDNPNDIVIFRSGSGNATNLTPRTVDVTGLSYSTIRPTSGTFTVTSIETINATGVLVAVQDGPTHVSVAPVNSLKLQEWIDSRPSALLNPHEYTKLLQSISIRVG